MAPFLNAKGQPVKMSFFDLFGPSIPSRSGKGTPPLEKKPKKEEPSTETSPKSTAAIEAPTESVKTAEPVSAEWTKIEGMGLLGMKALNMSWKEIGEALPTKDMEDIKKKYRELYVDLPANIKPKETEVQKEETKRETEDNEDDKKEDRKEDKKEDEKEAKGNERKAPKENKKGAGDGKEGSKGGKRGKKGQKGQKGQKGKEKVEEAKPEEAIVVEARPEERKGVLKAKATAGEMGKDGDLKSIHGHPVIFVDDKEELDFEELLYLYGLNARYDEQKWITVDSKFFDRFGKRIGADKLKEKLAGIW